MYSSIEETRENMTLPQYYYYSVPSENSRSSNSLSLQLTEQLLSLFTVTFPHELASEVDVPSIFSNTIEIDLHFTAL